MQIDRRVVLSLSLAVITAITVVILQGLVGTIFFAITVAYVHIPLDDSLEQGGLPGWAAAAAATMASFIFGLAVILPIGAVLYARRQAAIAFL